MLSYTIASFIIPIDTYLIHSFSPDYLKTPNVDGCAFCIKLQLGVITLYTRSSEATLSVVWSPVK